MQETPKTEEDNGKGNQSQRKECPVLRATLLSKLTFWWIIELVRKGYRSPLEAADIYSVMPHLTSEHNEARLNRVKLKGKASTNLKANGRVLLWQLVQSFPTDLLSILGCFIVTEAVRLFQPYLLGLLLDYLTDDHDSIPQWRGWLYTGLIVVTMFIYILLMMQAHYLGQVFGLKCRATLSTAMYRKVLKIWTSEHQQITSGQIINLLATDVEQINTNINWSIAALIQSLDIFPLVYILCREFGISSLAVFGTVVVIFLVSVVLSRKYANLRPVIAKGTDRRVQLMNEIIAAIRVIKMYCWERPFEELIGQTRKREMNKIHAGNLFRSTTFSIGSGSGRPMMMVTMAVYYQTGASLTISTVFKTMMYLELLRMVVFIYIPTAVQDLGQLTKSLRRIQTFLLAEEKTAMVLGDDGHGVEERSSCDTAVHFSHVSASWDSKPSSTQQVDYQVKDMSFLCEKASLTAIIGAVGSGKSSVLLHILGEIPNKEGSLKLDGRVSYSPQEPWIFSSSLQDNVLFGEKMDPKKYWKVLDVCGLLKDIENMPERDQTQVGERGLTLSGGQKARISLARAVYRDADVYLLDDPLSAVDTKVARHIFDHCITQFLADKSVILVTHQLQFLSGVDNIVLLEDGSVKFTGTFEELSKLDSFSIQLSRAPVESARITEDEDQPVTQGDSPATEVHEDQNAAGNVDFGVYRRYVRSGGHAVFLLTLLLYFVKELLGKASDWHLGRWLEAEHDIRNNVTDTDDPEDSQLLFYCLGSASFVCYVFAPVPLVFFLTRASTVLHNNMFHRIMGAPSRFFDVHPVGNILNRFSRDMGFVDLLLPLFLVIFAELVSVSVSGAVISCVVLPWVVIPTLFICLSLYGAVHVNVKASRDLKRLEAAARSPVYSHLSETFNGLQSIRVFRKEDDFLAMFNAYQDEQTMRWFLFLSAFRWLGLCSSFIGVVFLVFVSAIGVALKGEVSPALLGLILTYTLVLLDPFEFSFRLAAEIENTMTSAERILVYGKLEQESPAVIDGKRPPDSWPQTGNIEFREVTLVYFEGAPTALKNVSFSVMDKEKIGIVGRSGSGKSSLLHVLFRLTEPLGTIWIDGVDVTEIGVQDLRNKLSVIPQDPVLFSGTMRRNLDPFASFSDSEIWEALQKVQLEGKVRKMERQLDAEVYEGGSNLSVGQRQLVCLARALLKRNKILVLDEATANVDQETDEMIQDTIRQHFADCTVLTIAHRLNTVMDSDRILVMHDGKLAELDVPHVLLQNEDGLLYNYVAQTGAEKARELLEIAKQAYDEKTTMRNISLTANNVTSVDKNGSYVNQAFENTPL